MVNIAERIKEIEKFLNKEEKTPEVPLAPAPIPTPSPETAPTPMLNNNAEIIGVLRRILINQLIERRSWERSNPLITDNPVYDWIELATPAGFIATFTLTVPEGRAFFFDYFNITYRDDTIYTITIDGVAEPTTTEPVMDWADHYLIFRPPRLCYEHVIITALNNGDETQTYGCFMRGFFRQTVKVDKDYIGAR